MKKLLFTLLLLGWCHQSWGAYTLISNTCAASANTTSITTAAINTTGANLIVLAIGHASSSPANTPTDSVGGNTWTGLTDQSASGNNGIKFYYAANPFTGAAQTFTESGSSNYPSICVQAWSGSIGSSPFDVQNGAQTASSVTTLQPGSVTPSLNNELVLTASSFGNATMSIGSGFTIPTTGQVNGISSNSYGTAMAYLVQTSASAINPTWTISVGSAQALATVIATFKAVSAPTSAQINFNTGVKINVGTKVY